MTTPTRLLPLLLLGSLAGTAAGDPLVVVVSAQQRIERLSQEDVTNIFLGRFRTLPSGLPAAPIDQPANSPLRAAFYQQLVNKDIASINAYWSRLHFSGKATPPRQTNSDGEVLRQLLSQPGAIAYVERRQVDARLRIVFEFPP